VSEFTGVMENLEKSWNRKNGLFPGLEKSKFGNVLCSYSLHSLIKIINIYINMYSFNQTIVSHSFMSFKLYLLIYTTRIHKMFSPGNP